MSTDESGSERHEGNAAVPWMHIVLGAFGIIVIVALLGLGIWGLWTLATSRSETLVAVVGGTVAIITAILTAAITKYYERKNAIEADLRAQKIPVYEEFIHFMLDTILKSASKDAFSEQEIISFFQKFTPRITLWGSDDVLLAYRRFRQFGTAMKHDKADNTQILFCFEDIVLAMRRDLGFKNANFEKGALLSMFINDPESLAALAKPE